MIFSNKFGDDKLLDLDLIDLVNELKALLVDEIKKEIGKFLEDKNQEIVSFKSSVSLLQQQVNEICKQNLLLQEKSEYSEQYSCRRKKNFRRQLEVSFDGWKYHFDGWKYHLMVGSIVERHNNFS